MRSAAPVSVPQKRPRAQEIPVRFAIGDCSLGSILVAASGIGICAIAFGDNPRGLERTLRDRFPHAQRGDADPVFKRVLAAVIAFVERPTAGFPLPMDIRGTPFQRRVWQALREIPLGTTVSYVEIATRIGRPPSSRAVAQACAANPLPVAIPCHRVIRADGSLSGYHSGVERKVALLERERRR